MNLRNKTASEFRTVFDSPLGVPNSQVLLYFPNVCPHLGSSKNFIPTYFSSNSNYMLKTFKLHTAVLLDQIQIIS